MRARSHKGSTRAISVSADEPLTSASPLGRRRSNVDEYFGTNRDFWDEVVAVHVRSRGPHAYNVDDFKRGGTALHSVELEEVGDVKGKDLLHLQCHFGLDTLSWARLGARVTGVDFSDKGIEQATALAAELGIDARFILTNLYELPKQLEGNFDIVFTSHGVLNWLPDLAEWGRIIAHFLRPGGFFYIVDAHPFSHAFYDEADATELKLGKSYWPTSEPMRFEEDGDYADRTAHLEHQVTFEWGHTLGEIVNGLTDAGLRIDFLHEFPFLTWELFPFLIRSEGGYYHLPDGMPKIPLMFSIKATKPAH